LNQRDVSSQKKYVAIFSKKWKCPKSKMASKMAPATEKAAFSASNQHRTTKIISNYMYFDTSKQNKQRKNIMFCI